MYSYYSLSELIFRQKNTTETNFIPVSDTNAIGDKLTMMVEMLDAPVAQSAVFSS